MITSYGTLVAEWPKDVKKKKRKQPLWMMGGDGSVGSSAGTASANQVEEDLDEEDEYALRIMAGPLFRNFWNR